ncbi:UNVERIFIED_CONTAM: hypothetical protein Sradi_3428600 [Sesamum radiatum]|uniref:Uncharacterized protein n=1 Tax=Sesamum radiatum TaxID=300843 RepID=A0AAW2R587_SESRA
MSAGDNSPKEVSEEVLRRGGSVARSICLRGAGIGTPLVGAKDVPVTTRKAWVSPNASTTLCLFGALSGASIVTHVLNSVFS